jgi:hypothetical protein
MPSDGVFTQTNNCNLPSKLPVQQTCTVTVTFTPPDSITYTGTLQVIGPGGVVISTLPLTGTGID